MNEVLLMPLWKRTLAALLLAVMMILPFASAEDVGEAVPDDSVEWTEGAANITRDLTLNDEGDDVSALQTALTDLCYYSGDVTGRYGEATKTAVEDFQRDLALAVTGVADKATQEAIYAAEYRPLRLGCVGEDVRQAQIRLMALGYYTGKISGRYLPATQEAIRLFQTANALPITGEADVQTLERLFSGDAISRDSSAAATPTPSPTPGMHLSDETTTPTPAPTIAPVNTPSAASVIASASALHRGDNGTAVKAMQQRLIDLGYLASGSADGIFGVKTYQALRDFQLANALYVDGVAGKNTIASLNSSSATGKNTARPNTTATPTPNISNDIGTTTKVSAENVVYEYWYSTVRNACRQYPYATVYDYSTGISWQVHMFSYGKHAEAEPLTAADTAKLEQAFGGNTWTPKAVWVIFADGTVRMATTHSMPHEVQHITDNNFPGHLCIHFPRTQAQVTAIGPYAVSHQQTVEKGWAETQAMIAN